MKTLLSLFDYSGAWSEPFADAGWFVIRIDSKIEFPDNFSTFNTNILEINAEWMYENIFENCETVDGVLSAVPCTDFAVSGSRHWKKKDATKKTLFGDFNRLDIFKELVLQTIRIIDICQPDFDAMENPVGRLSTLFPELGKPMYFDPYEFAGHLNPSPEDLSRLNEIRAKNGKGITGKEFEFILEKNAYTKRTGLWGNFNRKLEKAPIEPVKGAPTGTPFQRLGGTSAKTKSIRSQTPAGFAKAFFEANKDYKTEREEI